ncbi:hypothetical protein SD80_022490 [Scytonema tolypothrichoides VB-61278]|nr:hypothetical protein SD80_022490 [Scytonema tolypothrichoides VB-61278]
MKNCKRISILTSGGDCSGFNAVIRAVVNHATLIYDEEIFGISYATQGLLASQVMSLLACWS